MHGPCHGQHALSVLQIVCDAVLGELPLDAVAGAAHAGAVRAAALDHEAPDDPVENQAVIEFPVDQADEIVHGDRGGLGIQFQTDDTAVFHGDGYNGIFCHNKISFLIEIVYNRIKELILLSKFYNK